MCVCVYDICTNVYIPLCVCDFQPKYISGLLKMAEVRKREEERRIERKVQKEREEEGNQFADKEAFVTAAYKKKMLEQQALEEKERQEAAMEGTLSLRKMTTVQTQDARRKNG